LSDNVLGVITCPDTSLAPGGSETCTKGGGDATAGEFQNIATATGLPVDNTGAPVGNPLSATDTADVFGSAPAITLVKDVNGHNEPNAPGLPVPVGSTVTFTYLVTNTGDVTLGAIEVRDDVLGPITCPKTSLAPSQSQTCTATATAQTGAQTNVGTVTADPVDASGQSIGAETSASDPATYTGMTASVATTSSTTTTPTAAPSSALPPGSGFTAPNGLGGIATDLGRLGRGGGTGSWALAGALILLASATGYYGARRRRRRGLQMFRSRSGR
jgi:trimeric autotransporter adhesin